jgi:hypothetical protein
MTVTARCRVGVRVEKPCAMWCAGSISAWMRGVESRARPGVGEAYIVCGCRPAAVAPARAAVQLAPHVQCELGIDQGYMWANHL